jgi:hypothetical protein
MAVLQRLLPAEPTHRTYDLHHIAVIQSLGMKVYGLQAAALRLDCRNRPEADVHGCERARGLEDVFVIPRRSLRDLLGSPELCPWKFEPENASKPAPRAGSRDHAAVHLNNRA